MRHGLVDGINQAAAALVAYLRAGGGNCCFRHKSRVVSVIAIETAECLCELVHSPVAHRDTYRSNTIDCSLFSYPHDPTLSMIIGGGGLAVRQSGCGLLRALWFGCADWIIDRDTNSYAFPLIHAPGSDRYTGNGANRLSPQLSPPPASPSKEAMSIPEILLTQGEDVLQPEPLVAGALSERATEYRWYQW